MRVAKTFRYRLEPNTLQLRRFAQFAGCCRFVFNQGLIARKAHHQEAGALLSYADLCKRLTQMKKSEETAWLGDVHSQVLQQALKDLDTAYRNFFRRSKEEEAPGFPKFKKKGQKDAFRFPQGVKVAGGRVYLPRIGWVRYRDSRPLSGRIRQATIKREGKHWFLSLACDLEVVAPASVPPTPERAVGIDLGLKHFAVLSDGTEIENPRFLKEGLAELGRAQRRLARMTRHSRNWKKQLARVVRLHVRIKNRRNDFAHKVSSAIVKNHDVIAVEDLSIEPLLRNRQRSRSIHDVAWGRFLAMLRYKAAWAGKHFVPIDRFVATSQLCSTCGSKKPMPLSVRTYACQGCGMTKDRDWNASLNIRAAGLAVLDACGGALVPVKQESPW